MKAVSYVVSHDYVAINFTTVAIMKIVAKNPKEAMKPTPESTASLRLLCTFFSNSFTFTPPIS